MNIRDAAISRVDANRMLAWTGILYRTESAGTLWELVPARFEGYDTNPELENLAFDAVSADVAWATAGPHVLRSTDFGVTWRRWGNRAPGENIGSLAVDPNVANAAWIGTIGGSGAGVHRTTNGGITWSRLGSTFVVDVNSVAPDPTNASILVASTAQGIARSTNGGDSWSIVSAGGTASSVRWSANGLVVRALQNGLRNSTDGGATWTVLPPPADQARAHTFDANLPDQLAIVPHGIYGFLDGSPPWCSATGWGGAISRSTSSGASWTEPVNLTRPANQWPPVMGMGDVDRVGSTLLAWYPEIPPLYEPILRSTNAGANWTTVANGMAECVIDDLQVGSTGDVYAGNLGTTSIFGEQLNLRRSIDGQSGWESPYILYLASQGVYALSVHTARPGEGAIVGLNNGCDVGGQPVVARFTNGGADWHPENGWEVDGPIGRSSRDRSRYHNFSASIAFSHGSGESFAAWLWRPSDDPMIAARTTDGGSTFVEWDASGIGFHPLQPIITPESDGVIFALADAGDLVRRSTDGGFTWESRSSGIPNLHAVRLRMNPADGDHMLLAFEEGLPYVTRDGGTNWLRLDADEERRRASGATPTYEEQPVPESLVLHGVAIHDADWNLAADPPRVFLATDRGVWFSDEGFVNEGLPLIPLHRIAYSPAGGRLFAASTKYGAFSINLLAGAAPQLAAAGTTASGARGVQLTASPNPFAGRTSARFELSSPSTVILRVHDVAGRRVRTLTRGRLAPGAHDFTWDSRDDSGVSVAPGTYFLRLETESGTATRRIVRLR